MQRVKEGQLSELGELFERYNLALYNFFLKLTLETATSEDLTQNLFYRVIRYKHTFDAGNGTFKSWIYQMARNLHADHFKQRQRITEVVKNSGRFPEDVPEQPDRGYDEYEYEKLKTALQSLGPVDRELIVLSRYEGMKYAEIAKMKNVSMGSIKVQVHRALKELRSLYFKQQN
jgi:RNA polymerase sigma factor (sigma-70 family)